MTNNNKMAGPIPLDEATRMFTSSVGQGENLYAFAMLKDFNPFQVINEIRAKQDLNSEQRNALDAVEAELTAVQHRVNHELGAQDPSVELGLREIEQRLEAESQHAYSIWARDLKPVMTAKRIDVRNVYCELAGMHIDPFRLVHTILAEQSLSNGERDRLAKVEAELEKVQATLTDKDRKRIAAYEREVKKEFGPS